MRTVDASGLWVRLASGSRCLGPSGYRARFDPVELVDEDGRTVAREGERLVMGGGFYDEQMPRCGLERDRIARVAHVQVEAP